jgi:hypothetical protein
MHCTSPRWQTRQWNIGGIQTGRGTEVLIEKPAPLALSVHYKPHTDLKLTHYFEPMLWNPQNTHTHTHTPKKKKDLEQGKYCHAKCIIYIYGLLVFYVSSISDNIESYGCMTTEWIWKNVEGSGCGLTEAFQDQGKPHKKEFRTAGALAKIQTRDLTNRNWIQISCFLLSVIYH